MDTFPQVVKAAKSFDDPKKFQWKKPVNAPLRAVSTLKIPLEFRLEKGAEESSFLYFYNKWYSGGPKKRTGSTFLLNLVYQSLWPCLRSAAIMNQIEDTKKEADKKKLKPIDKIKFLNMAGNADKGVLKRVTGKHTGFIYDAPMGGFVGLDDPDKQKAIIESLLQVPDFDMFKASKLQAGFVPANTYVQDLALKGEIVDQLKKCFMGLLIEQVGTTYWIYTRWFIKKEEAEFLTCTQFAGIRTANLYVMLHHWSGSSFGETATVPTTSMAITHIAAETKKEMETGTVINRGKVGDGIVVMDDGTLFWLPDVDKAVDYEEALQDYGQQEDGSYTFTPLKTTNGEKVFTVDVSPDDLNIGSKKKLPANMPIYTDWVNMKFAYSMGNGMLNVEDLSRCVELRPYHARIFLERKLTDYENDDIKFIGQVFTAALTIDKSILSQPTAEELEAGRLPPDTTVDPSYPIEYVLKAAARAVTQKLAEGAFGTMQDVKVHHLNTGSEIVALRCIGRTLVKALKVCEDNIENIYRRYAVVTVGKFMARLKIFGRYGHQYAKVVTVDTARRDPYINQGVSADYKQESVPMIRKEFSFMPHQFKLANLMRPTKDGTGPKFAIYDVDAGGGKTLSILTNILLELKRGSCHRPLVMCPTHLVSSYVKEAVYVTQGRVNIIPITWHTFYVHGFDRFTKYILSAPPNTIFVTDYNFLKRRGRTIAYGTKPVNIYLMAEYLRQFAFDLVALDECHKLKNAKAAVTEATRNFIADIPMKRLASGTLITDTPLDLVDQFAFIDPSVFGDREAFLEEFALEVRGGKAMAWKKGAGQKIKELIRQHCIMVSARRKEWASLLPKPHESFYAVGFNGDQDIDQDALPGEQRKFYQDILKETEEKIKEGLLNDKKLKKAMESAEDEEKFDSLADALRPYLARLESYCAAPGKDQFAKLALQGEDLISPKTRMVIALMRYHMAKPSPDKAEQLKLVNFLSHFGLKWTGKPTYGKILIFTNHIAVAEDIYETMPPDLKPMCIHYVAEQKEEAKNEFEKNKNKMMMVGVETSMNTGLNFQFVSRLIRVETVWTPGEMEQGNSRINRPEIKKDDLRKEEFGGAGTFLDWIVVNRTIDITKISRLLAKQIQKAKTDEPDNMEFQALKEVKLLPMTLDNIRAQNDWDTTLKEYHEAYNDFRITVQKDYADYKENNKDKMDPVEVPSAPPLPGSKLLKVTPYCPDMNIFGADKLGLVRLDEYLRDETYDIDEDEEGDSESTGEYLKKKAARDLELVSGHGCHTELGDGIIVHLFPVEGKVKIQLESGQMVNVKRSAVFLITKSLSSSIEIRDHLLQAVGDLPIDGAIGTQVVQKGKKPDEHWDQEEPVVKSDGVSASFYFTVVNDYLGLGCQIDEGNKDLESVLANSGFRRTPKHVAARVKSPQTMLALFKAWKAKGFIIPGGTVGEQFKQIYTLMTKKAGAIGIGLAQKVSLQNFYLGNFKQNNDPKKIFPYPVIRIVDNVPRFYVVMPLSAQVGTKKAIKITVPGVKWTLEGGQEMIAFKKSKEEMKSFLLKLDKIGVEVMNKGEISKEFKGLKLPAAKKAGKDSKSPW